MNFLVLQMDYKILVHNLSIYEKVEQSTPWIVQKKWGEDFTFGSDCTVSTKQECVTVCLHFIGSVLEAGLQYTSRQETGAKPRDFARTQAKKYAGVFTKFSCLREFATRRADHQGVRPLVYRKILQHTSVPVRKKTKWRWHAKRKIALVFRFSSVALFVLLFFPLFLFFSFFADSNCRENH